MGNVHPNGAGYDAIAAAVIAAEQGPPVAVPLPAAAVMALPMIAGLIGAGWVRRRRAR